MELRPFVFTSRRPVRICTVCFPGFHSSHLPYFFLSMDKILCGYYLYNICHPILLTPSSMPIISISFSAVPETIGKKGRKKTPLQIYL